MNKFIRFNLEDIVEVDINRFCCGVIDVDGASTARNESSTKVFVECVLETALNINDEDALPAHLIFTQARGDRHRRGYGFRIAGYIRKHGLGTVTVSSANQNPNTGNYITVFVWTPNEAADKLAKTLNDYDEDKVDFS